LLITPAINENACSSRTICAARRNGPADKQLDIEAR
jgi:hypothetical protein